MLPACASSGAALPAVSGACPGVGICPGVCPAALVCLLLEPPFSAGQVRGAMDGGTVTQFASVVSAGCITCRSGAALGYVTLFPRHEDVFHKMAIILEQL